jgi:hypothetical protein
MGEDTAPAPTRRARAPPSRILAAGEDPQATRRDVGRHDSFRPLCGGSLGGQVTPGYGGQYARPECIPTRSSGEKATSDPCHANGPCPRNASTRFTGRNLQGFGTDAAGSVSRVWTRSIRPRSVPGAQGEGGGGGAVPTIDRRGASGRRIAVRFLPSAPYAGDDAAQHRLPWLEPLVLLSFAIEHSRKAGGSSMRCLSGWLRLTGHLRSTHTTYRSRCACPAAAVAALDDWTMIDGWHGTIFAGGDVPWSYRADALTRRP